MPSKVWIDGQLYDKNDARISVFDHGLLFGDGVWEGMRIYEGRVFKLREHLDRLQSSASAIALTLPLSLDKLTFAVEETVAASGRRDGYVRLTVTRGPGTLGLDPRKCEPAVIIMAEDVVPYPREVYDAGLEVLGSDNAPDLVFPTTNRQIKTLNYLDHVIRKAQALRRGYLDAILFDPQANAIGTTDGNLFVLRGQELRTHPVDQGAYPGITRGVVLELARGIDLSRVEDRTTATDLLKADELFLTSTTAEIIGIVRIDGQVIGSGREGPITRQLRELYHAAVRGSPG